MEVETGVRLVSFPAAAVLAGSRASSSTTTACHARWVLQEVPAAAAGSCLLVRGAAAAAQLLLPEPRALPEQQFLAGLGSSCCTTCLHAVVPEASTHRVAHIPATKLGKSAQAGGDWCCVGWDPLAR